MAQKTVKFSPSSFGLAGADLAARVAWLSVDVELKELVLVQETSPGFVHEKVVRVLLESMLPNFFACHYASDK